MIDKALDEQVRHKKGNEGVKANWIFSNSPVWVFRLTYIVSKRSFVAGNLISIFRTPLLRFEQARILWKSAMEARLFEVIDGRLIGTRTPSRFGLYLGKVIGLFQRVGSNFGGHNVPLLSISIKLTKNVYKVIFYDIVYTGEVVWRDPTDAYTL